MTLLIVCAAAILSGVVGGDDTEEFTVGSTGRGSVTVVEAARAAAPGLDARIESRRVTSAEAGRKALRAEELDALLVGGRVLVTKEKAPDRLQQLFQIASRQVRGVEALRARGLDERAAERALDPPPLRARALESDDKKDER